MCLYPSALLSVCPSFGPSECPCDLHANIRVTSVVAVSRCSTSDLHTSIFKLPFLGWSVAHNYLYFTCVFLTAWFVYVYGCLSVWMVVCVCDHLSAYVSGLVSVLSYIGLLCAYISMYLFGLISTCVSACVYVVCICMYIWLTTYISIYMFVCRPISIRMNCVSHNSVSLH